MLQYRKTVVAEFFFKVHSPLLEMIFFWKQTSSQLLKFADIFGTSFPQEHAPVNSFSQHDKPVTRERNVIHFGGYFIYCCHLWNAVRDFITLFTKYKTCLFYVIILSVFIIILSYKKIRLSFKENKTFSVIMILSFKEIRLFCLIIILSFKENKTFCLIITLSFR